MEITINQSALNAAIQKAFNETALIMDLEFTKAITDPVYPWPRGESPRDIVNLGQLRRSQTHDVNGLTATYRWPTEYSLIVHEGATLRNGTVLPPRRWTERAFKQRKPDVVFNKLLAAYLK